MTYPPLIAHRGESKDAPENTLAAINLAWQRGANAVEIDVHLTLDNEVCVIHDYTTKRTTGVRKRVRKTTMAELQGLNAGKFKGKEWEWVKIPTLKEVLETVPPNCKLIIEIKSAARILPHLKKIVESSSIAIDQVEVIAFNFNTIIKAKALMPNYKMHWLYVMFPPIIQYILGMTQKSIIAKVKKHKLDGVNISDSKYLTQSYIQKFKDSGLLVYVWTINSPKRAKDLLLLGIDFITTDCPWWMKNEMLK
jgi:glycerophosphoryl diester phosphodiesterase